jgi:hypothetical protein
MYAEAHAVNHAEVRAKAATALDWRMSLLEMADSGIKACIIIYV